MSRTPSNTLLDWLGLNASPDYARSSKLGRVIGVLLVSVCLVLVSISVIGPVLLLGAFIGFGPFAGDGTGAAIRNIGLVLAAVFGAPFIAWRSMIAQKQVEVAEQGHITDRINKAVEMLGADKTVKRHRRRSNSRLTYAKGEDGKPDFTKPVMEEVSQPNIEVRIGAIYALERIAQDSDRDHVQIMEILCAYIRQNAPAESAVEWPTLEMLDSEEDGPLAANWRERLKTFREKQEALKKTLICRTDIQTALSVIGRRTAHQRALEAEAGHGEEGDVFVFDTPCPTYNPPEEGDNAEQMTAYSGKLSEWKTLCQSYRGYKLDLRHSNLQGADLSRLNLSGALLDGARMQGANLGMARMQGANLREARMQGAKLWEAQMQEANLWMARMQGTNLREARMQGAKLWEAQMQEANLWKAQMQGADLWMARMQGAGLRMAQMQGAILRGAQMQAANLWAAQMQGAGLEEARMQAADLRRARMQGAGLREMDCTEVPQIAVHIPNMFGDGTVTLPEDVNRPAHWPKHDLGNEFKDEWRKWQADPDNYKPPVIEDEAGG